MKKVLISIMAVILAVTGIFALTACNNGDEEAAIASIELKLADKTVIKVNDEYDPTVFVLTAVLKDGTKKAITKTTGVDYDKSGLALAKGKYTRAGKFTIKVTYLKYATSLEFTVVE